MAALILFFLHLYWVRLKLFTIKEIELISIVSIGCNLVGDPEILKYEVTVTGKMRVLLLRNNTSIQCSNGTWPSAFFQMNGEKIR